MLFSGGETAVALLAANPAVRELLLRPLAIRQASLRRYIAGACCPGGCVIDCNVLCRLLFPPAAHCLPRD